ncbi:MAG: hypothetical protein PWP23_734 [Candidatus Sumerlaeota bacterium]|nr:hypothetical protein [Candidatus Sumerlaeota bacterium]
MSSDSPPLKKRFPAWVRRKDPLLAAEDTNALYLAMEQLRVSRRKRRKFFQSAPAPNQGTEAWVTLGYVLLSLVLVVATLLTLGLTRRWLDKVNKEMTKPRKASWTTIPSRIAAIFGGMQYCEAAALDLWMTGLTASEITEAHYLEIRRDWLVGLIVSIAVYVVISGFLCTMVYVEADLPVAWLLLAIAALLYLGDAFFRVAGAGLKTQDVFLDSTSFMWFSAAKPYLQEEPEAPKLPWRERIRNSCLELVKIVAALVVLGAIVGVCIFVFRLVAYAVGTVESVISLSVVLPWLALAAVVLIGVVVRRRAAKPPTSEQLEKKAKQAEERRQRLAYTFNLYMSVVVMRDPDGERWARETFPRGYELAHPPMKNNDPADAA